MSIARPTQSWVDAWRNLNGIIDYKESNIYTFDTKSDSTLFSQNGIISYAKSNAQGTTNFYFGWNI